MRSCWFPVMMPRTKSQFMKCADFCVWGWGEHFFVLGFLALEFCHRRFVPRSVMLHCAYYDCCIGGSLQCEGTCMVISIQLSNTIFRLLFLANLTDNLWSNYNCWKSYYMLCQVFNSVLDPCSSVEDFSAMDHDKEEDALIMDANNIQLASECVVCCQ